MTDFGGYTNRVSAISHSIKESLLVKNKTRKKMLSLAKALDVTVSFDKTWEIVSKSWSGKQRENALEAFEKMGLNPIPLQYKKMKSLPSVPDILASLDSETDEVCLCV